MIGGFLKRMRHWRVDGMAKKPVGGGKIPDDVQPVFEAISEMVVHD